MKCPQCDSKLEIPDHIQRNMECYGKPVIVSPPCCSKPLILYPQFSFKPAAISIIERKTDDWGTPFK